MRLEICKDNGESFFVEVYRENGDLKFRRGLGIRGTYMPENISSWKLDPFRERRFIEKYEELNIDSWPQTIPEDYVPDYNADSCEPGTWTIRMQDRKEENKPWIIYGKGPFPEDPPYCHLLWIIDPTLDLWLNDDENND